MLDTAGQMPSWLTKEYLQDKLRIFYKDAALQLLEMSVKAASGKGQNWVGVMTRIYTKFQREDGKEMQQTYVLKEACPSGNLEAKVFNEFGLYTREMLMYETILPALSKILQEVGIEGKLHADAVSVDYEHTTLIMEDLGVLKYRDAKRLERLDILHVHLVLDKLAKYHAAGAILQQRQPELFVKNFDRSFFTRGLQGFQQVVKTCYRALMRYVKTQPKLNERYYEKLERLYDNAMEYAARSFDVDSNDFQTLSHGDCWTTNFMFRYNNDGVPLEVVPIDFQFSSWTSPLTDLHYFFSSSLREGLEDQQTNLVYFYYTSLREALLKLKYEGRIPSLRAYQIEFKKRSFMSVLISLLFQPLQLYDGTEDSSFEKIFVDHEEAIRFQDSVYEDPKTQRNIERLLPIFDAEGLLDDSE